jgi:serine/threonine-protein kinase RsbT
MDPTWQQRPMQPSAIKYEPYTPYVSELLPTMTALTGADEIRVPVESDTDIVAARRKGRALAAGLGFSSSDATMVATAISELARNIVLYAMRGEIRFHLESHGEHPILVITARDEGDGIADVRQALQDGYSTSGRLGVGLPGVKRLMDELEISSTVGRGTVVVVKKWKQ